jgi:DNA helicase-2/ATP-dependent DNA helicase PcrA
MNGLLDKLNDEQRAVVECTEGPVVVFAGAGTGKTRAVTYRIAYLLANGVAPERILAVTFTNKAAGEMKSRVAALVPGRGERVWMSTFHSFCAKFLRLEHAAAGLPASYVIYDDADQKQVIRSVMKDLMLHEKDLSIETVREMISRAKDGLVDAESYRINSCVYKDDANRETVAEIYLRYQQRLDAAHALDFGDLIMRAVGALRSDDALRRRWADRFRYIHVDEYQDVNLAQAALVRCLGSEHHNICVVGDDDQAIYSWRGADVNYLLNFTREHPGAREFRLQRNYRSSKIILDVGNALISHNNRRARKALWTDKTDCTSDDVTVRSFAGEREEAQFVAQEIARLSAENPGGTAAVFYRTNAQSRVFEEVFQQSRIPYVIVGSVGFYEHQEIKDVLAYLKLAVNPDDEVALTRIINVPTRGIGETTVLYLATLAHERGVSLWRQLADIDATELSARAKNAVWRFLSLYDALRKDRETMFPSEFIRAVLEKTGYLAMLEQGGDPHRYDRLANIEELISAARAYEMDENVATVEEFLERVALVTRAETAVPSPDAHVVRRRDNPVRMMTVHAAKGLEFDTVFVSGLEERVFPVWWALNGGDDAVEEERRLAYVAITRACSRLYLTYSQTRRVWGVETHLHPSRFVREILDRLEVLRPEGSAEETPEYQRSQTVPERHPDTIAELRTGDFVHHEKFGYGKVVDIVRDTAGNKVEVVFHDGERRRLHLGYTSLRRMTR